MTSSLMELSSKSMVSRQLGSLPWCRSCSLELYKSHTKASQTQQAQPQDFINSLVCSQDYSPTTATFLHVINNERSCQEILFLFSPADVGRAIFNCY